MRVANQRPSWGTSAKRVAIHGMSTADSAVDLSDLGQQHRLAELPPRAGCPAPPIRRPRPAHLVEAALLEAERKQLHREAFDELRCGLQSNRFCGVGFGFGEAADEERAHGAPLLDAGEVAGDMEPGGQRLVLLRNRVDCSRSPSAK